VLLVFLCQASSQLPSSLGTASSTKEALDAFSGVTKPQHPFPKSEWKRLQDCFHQEKKSQLEEASDQAWKKITDFAIAGGSLNDTWTRNTSSPYLEFRPTNLTDKYLENADKIVVYEPCNTVSNFVYFRSMVELCESRHGLFKYPWLLSDSTMVALLESLLGTGIGSALFHGSGTRVGLLTDNLFLTIFPYVAYQAVVQVLPFDPVIYGLKNETRAFTAVEASTESMRILREDSIEDWSNPFQQFLRVEIPDFELCFGAFFLIPINLLLSESLATAVAETLVGLLSPDSPLLSQVQPALRQAIEEIDIKLSPLQWWQVSTEFLGTVIKLLYGFVWQEEVLGFSDSFNGNKFANRMGAIFMPVVNFVSNKLTGYPRWRDIGMQASLATYPGSRKCDIESAHAKWHEASSNGLVDMVYLADRLLKIMTKQTSKNDKHPIDALQCLLENGCFSGSQESQVELELFSATFEVAAARCIPNLLSALSSELRTGSFATCFATQLKSVSRETAASEDMLFLENCLAFEGTGSINETHLASCVTKSYPLDEDETKLSCIRSCQGVVLCSLLCVRHFLSNEASRTLTCVASLLDGSGSSRELVNECTSLSLYQTGQADNATLFGFMDKGLRRLARCTLEQGPCSDSFGKAMQFRHDIWACLRSCQERKDEILPLSWQCSLTCVSEFV